MDAQKAFDRGRKIVDELKPNHTPAEALSILMLAIAYINNTQSINEPKVALRLLIQALEEAIDLVTVESVH